MTRTAAKIFLILSMSAVVQAADEYLTLLGFELEKTTLSEIQSRLGTAPIKHTGDAAEAYYGICYLSREHNATVYFESGEMGGPEHTLLGFAVRNTMEKSQICGDLKTDQTNLTLGAIEPGRNIDDVRRELPQPVKNISNGIQYQQLTQVPFTKKEVESMQIQEMRHAFWDVTVTIRVFEDNGTVSGYEVSKVTSW